MITFGPHDFSVSGGGWDIKRASNTKPLGQWLVSPYPVCMVPTSCSHALAKVKPLSCPVCPLEGLVFGFRVTWLSCSLSSLPGGLKKNYAFVGYLAFSHFLHGVNVLCSFLHPGLEQNFPLGCLTFSWFVDNSWIVFKKIFAGSAHWKGLEAMTLHNSGHTWHSDFGL